MLALAAACFAGLHFHVAAGLGALPGGGAVGRFWLAAIALAYLPFALAAALISRLASRIGGSAVPPVLWREGLPARLLRVAATVAYFAGAALLNRPLFTRIASGATGRAATIALYLALTTALIVAVSPGRWRWPRRVAFVALLVATLGSLRGHPPPPLGEPPPLESARPTGQRLLLVGLDGADPRTVDRLIAEGELPNLAGLRARGVSGPLATLTPTSSPLIWTTMITGRSPAEHGVQGHVFERPKWIFERVPDPHGELRGMGISELRNLLRRIGWLVISPATSQERRVPALWNVTTHYRQPISVVGWWATWPAEAILGRISSDRFNYFRWEARGATDLDRRRVTFPDSLDAALRRVVLAPTDITYEQARRFLDVDAAEFEADRTRGYRHHEIRSEFRYYYSQFETDLGVARYFLRADRAAGQEPMDLLVLFRLIDQTSHCCLSFSNLVEDDLGASATEKLKYGRVVREAYRAADSAVGELTQLFGVGNVIVVSDHGFEKTRAGGKRQYAHPSAPPGIFIAAGPAFRSGTAQELHVSQLMALMLFLKGLPISEEIRAPVRRDLFTPEFAVATPVLSVPSYGALLRRTPIEGESSADRALLEELQALGYIQ